MTQQTENPVPAAAGRLIITSKDGVTITLSFDTYSQAEVAAQFVAEAIAIKSFINIKHVGGNTRLFRLHEIFAVTVANRLEEDDYNLHSIPYNKYIEHKMEEAEEIADADYKPRMGI